MPMKRPTGCQCSSLISMECSCLLLPACIFRMLQYTLSQQVLTGQFQVPRCSGPHGVGPLTGRFDPGGRLSTHKPQRAQIHKCKGSRAQKLDYLLWTSGPTSSMMRHLDPAQQKLRQQIGLCDGLCCIRMHLRLDQPRCQMASSTLLMPARVCGQPGSQGKIQGPLWQFSQQQLESRETSILPRASSPRQLRRAVKPARRHHSQTFPRRDTRTLSRTVLKCENHLCTPKSPCAPRLRNLIPKSHTWYGCWNQIL